MAYATKQIDHEKRKNQEGSYSLYNYLYHYLLDNYEPETLESSYACEATENLLTKEGIAYARKAGNNTDESFVRSQARQAITNFVNNKGAHGDTGTNFGKCYDNSFDTVKRSIQDLRW
jgi:hypothetical protein